jgi:hypothetical protein
VDVFEDVLAVDLRPALGLAEGHVDRGFAVRRVACVVLLQRNG